MERSFKGSEPQKIQNPCIMELVLKLLSLGQDHVTLMELALESIFKQAF